MSRHLGGWSVALAAAVVLAGCGGGGDDADSAATTTATSAVAATTQGASAAAAATVKAHVAVTPDAAGTDAAPRGVSVDLAVDVRYPDADDAAPMKQVDIGLPAGMRFHGDALPKGTRTGRGTATAEITGSAIPASIVVRNGGPGRLNLDLTVTNPARVDATVVGQVTDASGGGQRLRLTIPKELQEIAGVPVAIRRLALKAGKGSWLTTTSCPGAGHWTYPVAVTFADGATVQTTAAAPCR